MDVLPITTRRARLTKSVSVPTSVVPFAALGTARREVAATAGSPVRSSIGADAPAP